MSEANLEQQCVALTKRNGGLMLKLLPWLVRGLPDRILLLPGGWIAFIELKAPEGRLTLLQGWWQRKLTELGFRHRVVRTLVEFDAVLEEWRDDDTPEWDWEDLEESAARARAALAKVKS